MKPALQGIVMGSIMAFVALGLHHFWRLVFR